MVKLVLLDVVVVILVVQLVVVHIPVHQFLPVCRKRAYFVMMKSILAR